MTELWNLDVTHGMVMHECSCWPTHFIISWSKHPSLEDAYLVHELKKNVHIMDFIFKIALNVICFSLN
jgi:hypothetical protein